MYIYIYIYIHGVYKVGTYFYECKDIRIWQFVIKKKYWENYQIRKFDDNWTNVDQNITKLDISYNPLSKTGLVLCISAYFHNGFFLVHKP